MAIDNSSYDSLQGTFFKIKDYLENTQLGREHSPVMLKHEELGELLESFDVEALEEQTKNIQSLHTQLDEMAGVCKEIDEALLDTSDSLATAEKIAKGLDSVFEKIKNIVL